MTGTDFRISDQAQEIIDALKSVLECTAALYDAEKRMHHLAMPRRRWCSVKVSKSEAPKNTVGCVVHVDITDRWTLFVSSRRGLHPDAQSIAKWAAKRLAPHLPKRTADEPTYPPFGGGGGSGGSAEVGIPVWWARKARG